MIIDAPATAARASTEAALAVEIPAAELFGVRGSMAGMTATTIDTDQDVVTLINVFTVTPQTQQRLVDLLDEATEQVMRHRPGFVSATIHASLDGTRVANYAQWRSQRDFEAMLGDPTAQEHMQAAAAMAAAEPHLYRVSSVHHVSAVHHG
jgi:quinol monooxygenase YgiN